MEWSAFASGTGDGSDWITIDTKEGTGPTEVVFFFHEYVSGSAAAGYVPREMNIILKVDGVDYTIGLIQNPLSQIFT